MSERNLRKTRVGIVASDKMDKTVVVAIQDNVKHPLYKKIIKNTANSIRTKAIRLAATRRSGEGYIDTAVKILIAVVLGALLLAGLYALFGDVVMPTLNQRIKDMFNYAGALGG